MKIFCAAFLPCIVLCSSLPSNVSGDASDSATRIPGFRDAVTENSIESRFLEVPDPKRAQEHLRILTQAPHIAGSAEDKAAADYVAKKFGEAGFETEIVEYRVWMNYPSEVSVDVTAPTGVTMHGPTREHVDGDPYEEDPRVVVPFHGMSPSGDVEAEVVYVNYGTPEDFRNLEAMKIDLRGKIVLVRYGKNFRGVKVRLAQQHGATAVLIYSDPFDDGWRRGDKYPQGPWRPDTGVQRGSVGYMFEFPGDPTTPGIASLPSLPDDKRISPDQSAQMPRIPSTPLSYADARPILEQLGGPESPRTWQGSLPFTYHVGPGPVKVHVRLEQDYQFRTIWDVIGQVRGRELPDEWVIAGNHRDAWVYGAVDPGSGTAAMLESVHGIGQLLKSGWKPKRTIIFASWDAEEEGLIGSTEWAEQHAAELASAVAYFNTDVAVSGPKFGASAVPSLKPFIREITKAVPAASGGTVYDAWRRTGPPESETEDDGHDSLPGAAHPAAPLASWDVMVGDLGSGSDYTPFLQHLGVPSTDIGSPDSYGVYHSVFDDFAWFKKFADPDFRYEQQMARVFGLETIRMANADVLPFDYEEYGKEIEAYIDRAKKRADIEFGTRAPNFAEAAQAARRFEEAGAKILSREQRLPNDPGKLNLALCEAERALLIPEGLPNRPWYRHAIYAPGENTGYAAVVIPGVNEAIEGHDLGRTQQQIATLIAALQRAARVLGNDR